MTVGCVVLAAGGGSRFAAGGGGAHKLVTPFRGRPLVQWAVEAAISSGVGPVAVVEGAVPMGHLVAGDVVVLSNPSWASGQASSLGVAVAWARTLELSAVVVGLGDQPLVPASAWRAVAGAGPTPPVAVATYDGRRGNPVRLDASVWDRLSFSGDEGARELMRREPEVWGAVACEGNPADVDTVEDLAQWS
ncbi:MAG TPA: nucleotidyltransferase family protein [Acidimicrobiales bacterium]|nr:nucleotidyltransferase family protein [Acidimicrobiales bacterium]